jgi:uncharacterized protein involved in type VI secretion and phage assembly
MTEFFGKYRGVVTDNRDPLLQGRLRATVEDVFGEEECGWALPCVPYAGNGVGFFMLTPVGAMIWVEFEHGDPDYPIWSGCFWAEGEPPQPAQPETKIIKTDSGTILVDDTPGAGGITIETANGMKIVLNELGIEIDDGQGGSIKITNQTVSVNDGALEVT